MSSTNKTATLNLHSWVRTDPVVCDDFNDNFNKIDEAVADLRVSRGNCEIYCGTYTGTGTKMNSLTFPKLPLYLVIQSGASGSATHFGFVLDGCNFTGTYSSNPYYVSMSVSGTTVTFIEAYAGDSEILNRSGQTYRYIAFVTAG